MKLINVLILFVAIIMVSCSSTYQSTLPQDDIYYSGSGKVSGQDEALTVKSNTETYTSREVYQSSDYGEDESFSKYESEYDNDGYYEDEYYEEDFEMDDYYDYSYASRIKRFHGSGSDLGYYDNYYTNVYFYNYDPYAYGSSIYMGYNYWYPNYYYRPSLYFGYSWGWGGIGWGYPYSPYYNDYCWPYYCGWGGYPYYGSYWAGYWNGYYDGYYDRYYYNSYDYNSNYYGQRGTRGLNTNGTGGGSGTKTFGEKYEDAVSAGRIYTARNDQSGSNTISGKSGTAERVNTTRTTKEPNQSTAARTNTSGEVTRARTNYTGKQPAGNNETPAARITPATKNPATATAKREKLSKPAGTSESKENVNARRYDPNSKSRFTSRESYNERKKTYTKPQTYQKPDYRNARSSQEYTAPRSSLSSRSIQSRPATNNRYSGRTNNSGTYTRSGKSRSVSTPARTNTQRYSQPSSRSSNSYSTPSRSTRSFSTPSRSTNRSISSPSPSRSTISSPSRSSGSSSSGTRSGGSSRGGRK